MPRFIVIVGGSPQQRADLATFVAQSASGFVGTADSIAHGRESVRLHHDYDGRVDSPMSLLTSGTMTIVLTKESVRDLIRDLPSMPFAQTGDVNEDYAARIRVLDEHHAMTEILVQALVVELRAP